MVDLLPAVVIVPGVVALNQNALRPAYLRHSCSAKCFSRKPLDCRSLRAQHRFKLAKTVPQKFLSLLPHALLRQQG